MDKLLDFIKNHSLTASVLSAIAIGYLFNQYTLHASLGEYNIENSLSNKRRFPIRIKKLIIYPIKSCKGIEVRECKLDKYGIVNDRRFMLTLGESFISQKAFPRIGLITPRFSEDGKQLIVSAPGMEDLVISAEPLQTDSLDKSRLKKIKLHHDDATVYECSPETSQWFSRFLQVENVKFVQIPPQEDYHRPIRKSIALNLNKDNLSQYEHAFCNSAPIMIMSQASLDELNMRIDETRLSKNEQLTDDLTEDRFRPNILLVNTLPFEEDEWKTFRINHPDGKDINFTFGDQNGRCPITTIDQTKATFDPTEEPLRTLKTFRLTKCALGEKTLVGMYAVHSEIFNGYEIKVGSTLDIIDKGFTSQYFTKVNII
ncbi:molybdenum cofactor sulfurase domain-containing protein [Tieghemostelium lacteum]|uniref:Molybdenum cofactor sulfurase domain-containing protein n=1 Tax=Tieghemostelium lacteum TaxID=361077 RepID=A0A151ZS51_TIELA|nr:molybdenum cofactor sulfurase domain-containing protein [Tieghemostelium lacteum]|eukprot:KYQ96807.1 molybdenum cofactor sulfurase domain-containing protein [Tieghemostelium lacteum]